MLRHVQDTCRPSGMYFASRNDDDDHAMLSDSKVASNGVHLGVACVISRSCRYDATGRMAIN